MEDTTKFWIDRAFGGSIFVETDNGVVTKVYGEREQYNTRMEELYKGKEITFLKTNFEKRMKPSFHCVHSMAITSAMQHVEAIKVHIHQVNVLITGTLHNGSYYEGLCKSRTDLELELSAKEKELQSVRELMKTTCNWEFN